MIDFAPPAPTVTAPPVPAPLPATVAPVQARWTGGDFALALVLALVVLFVGGAYGYVLGVNAQHHVPAAVCSSQTC